MVGHDLEEENQMRMVRRGDFKMTDVEDSEERKDEEPGEGKS